MRKKFLRWLKGALVGVMSVLLGLTISTAEVSAEQAAAEQYRQMFWSGNFYVEYQTYQNFKDPVWGGNHQIKDNHIFAGRDGNRVVKHNAKSKLPEALYQGGKYYLFINQLKGLECRVLNESDLSSPNLNPSEGWADVRNKLSLPDEFAVFYWDDPFRAENVKTSAPYFNGSSTRTVDNKEYDCDQYIVDIKSLAGTTIAQWAYNMLYENGNIVQIQKYFLRDGKEALINAMVVKTITKDVPDTAFALKKKIKVYAADKGTMSDLIAQPVLVEEIGGK